MLVPMMAVPVMRQAPEVMLLLLMRVLVMLMLQ